MRTLLQRATIKKAGSRPAFLVIETNDRLLALLGRVLELVAALLDVLPGTLDGVAASQRNAKCEDDSDHCGKFFHDRTPESGLLTDSSVESPSVNEGIEPATSLL
jgi:hypothetical protein